MGLLAKLTKQDLGGSTLSKYDGKTPPINPLAGGGNNNKNFSLHFTPNINAPGYGDGSPGYSVTGGEFNIINKPYQLYEDGNNAPLPNSSQLDLLDPITADPTNKPKYTSIPSQTYSSLYNTF